MRRILIWATVAGTAVIGTETLLVSATSAQTQQLIDACLDERYEFSLDQRIAACTGLIETGKVFGKGLAWAFANRCLAHNQNNESDLALADCNQAIWLEPTIARAFTVRGNVYYDKGNNDLAIADYSQAIQLDSKDAVAYNNRGRAYYFKGDNERAISDYNQVIQFDPKDSRAYLQRALANFYLGALSNALADLNRLSTLDPKDAYTALWIDIVNKRSHFASGLAKATALIDMTKWPAPIVRLYLGQMKPGLLLAAFDDPNPSTKEGQVCEANFYSGEFAFQQGKKDEATRLFRIAVADCPKTFLEYAAANAELKALHATP